ncbi:MAG TPA: hypothetical protein VFB28_00220 [Terriglobales bacterium]|nr:hypothetical protein [Terriglobales bacterium]
MALLPPFGAGEAQPVPKADSSTSAMSFNGRSRAWRALTPDSYLVKIIA